MYVADESDGKVYSYNMPDAIDARLSSLSLSGVDIGEFPPNHEEYEGAAGEGVTETTVTAEALQRRTDVDIDPPDADEAAEGHQVALDGVAEITVTVTSADGSRERVYRVRLSEPEQAAASALTFDCFRGAVNVGFSLVVYAGRQRRGPRGLRRGPQRHGPLRARRRRVRLLHPRRPGLRESPVL